MALSRYRLGTLIELVTTINSDLIYGIDDVKGMTISKEIIPTKAAVNPDELPKFTIVSQFDFIYNPRTHGKKIGFGFNDEDKKFLISWNNVSFRIKEDKTKLLSPYYLWIWLRRDEWDRRAAFNSWGSSTEVFSWNELCEMEIDLPPISVQNKYVAIYKGMLDNQRVYEKGLDDIKLVCDLSIEKIKNEIESIAIGSYICKIDVRNTDKSISKVKNVSVSKTFNEPTAKVNRNELGNYKVVKPGQIAFVQTTHNEHVFCYALNEFNHDVVVSSVDEVFETDETKLIPQYLCLFFNRTEFDRYARFNSWGSARETFTWDDLINVKIPIPSIQRQKELASIFKLYNLRKRINDRLKKQINNICPVLINGSLKEGEMCDE